MQGITQRNTIPCIPSMKIAYKEIGGVCANKKDKIWIFQLLQYKGKKSMTS